MLPEGLQNKQKPIRGFFPVRYAQGQNDKVEGLFLAEDVAHAADLGANIAEFLFEVLVAAVEVVDVVEDSFSIGNQCREHERCAGA